MCMKGENEVIKNVLKSNATCYHVIEAMINNMSDAKVLEKYFNRIRELANNIDNRIEIGRAGGIRVIIEAMRVHIDEALVQVNACAALQKLAFSDSKYISAARTAPHGSTTVLTTKKKHNNNNDNYLNNIDGDVIELQEEFECCSSPEQLNSFNAPNMKQIISYGGQEAILSAMKRHPDHLPVQLYGICALACFTFSSDYLRLLHGDESKYLLEAAASRFPLMCRHDARNVLDRLSELA